MSDPNAFTYNYSAKEQAEIKKIREKYAPGTVDSPEGKLERIRRSDTGVTQKGTAWALALGVIGTFVLGIGMCCCLVWEQFFLGILIGVPVTAVLKILVSDLITHCNRVRQEKEAASAAMEDKTEDTI